MVDLLKLKAAFKNCTKCGACFRQTFDACPINKEFLGITPYSFMSIAMMADDILDGRMELSRELSPVFFSCTLCGYCAIQCLIPPLHFCWDSPTELIEGIRALFVEAGAIPAKISEILNNLALTGNAWKLPPRFRIEWEKECKVPIPDYTENHNEYLLFVGDAALIDETKSIVKSVAELLYISGVNFGTLKERELDSGGAAKELGEYGLFEGLAKRNIETFKECGARKVITISPHDYHTFLVDYPKLGFKFEKVYHHTQIIDELIRQGKINPVKEVSKRITYHDSCFLGRYHEIFMPPRNIIRSIPEVMFIEMKQNQKLSFCCGGGGGRLWYDVPEEPVRKRIPDIRVAHARDVRADIIATACPYCKSTLSAADNLGEIAVKDVAEILYESVASSKV
ncbi:MAG: (Fe-S)-binding protein [Candidatus Bathyarchaeia archaeon]